MQFFISVLFPQYYDLAADVMAENAHLTVKCLSPYLYTYFDAMLTWQTSPEEGFRKFELMATQQIEKLRKLTKQVQEHKSTHNEVSMKSAVEEYDETLE